MIRFCMSCLFLLSFTVAVSSQDGDDILAECGVSGGLIVHVGAGDGEMTSELRVNDSCLVQGLARDPGRVVSARNRLTEQGVYGPVSIRHWPGGRLPYADGLVNLLVVESAVPMSEINRVLAPLGTAFTRTGDGWQKRVKPWPGAIDEWSHYLHDASNNAVARDTRVSPPKYLQWKAKPLYCRSHEYNPSVSAFVSAGGRVFYIQDDGLIGLTDLRFPARWSLVARDAFSGVLLWKLPITDWGWRAWQTRGLWAAPLTQMRRLVAQGDRVFVTLGYNAAVSVLDAATGETIRSIEGTAGTDEMICSDGVLLLNIRDKLSVATGPPPKPTGNDKRKLNRWRRLNEHEWVIKPPGESTLTAVDPESGRILWQNPPGKVKSLTLAAADGVACFNDGEHIVCVDLKTGGKVWSAPCPAVRTARHTGGTLVMYDDIVLYTGQQGLVALSLTDGRKLWTGPKSFGPGIAHPGDLFVAGGLVWGGRKSGKDKGQTAISREGLDPATGEIRKRVHVPNLISPLHHFRCYRSKATDRFLLLTKRGVEFLDLEGSDHMRHDWLRAPCSYGFVPANGILYMPHHPCFCYPAAKLNGFNALAGTRPPALPETVERLQKGPAYGKVKPAGPGPGDAWPVYRHDAERSGATPGSVPVELERKWKVTLGGRITQPIFARGKLYVSRIDSHAVYCLDPDDGEVLWRFIAGGRVDSSPTYCRGLLLFGCTDGSLYAVDAGDGTLAWRFHAAPENRQIVVYNQLESAWPVHGSVVVLDGVVYCTAGRSTYLDSGIRIHGLDVMTGKLLHEGCARTERPDVQNEKGRPFDVEGARSDLLVSDGKDLYFYQMGFDRELKPLNLPRLTSLGDRRTGLHLITTNGFLDDSWFDRTFWMYSKRWPGFYFADKASKSGQILCFDDTTTYGLHVFTERARLSPLFRAGADGYELFADDNDNEPIIAERAAGREKGPGFSRARPPKWSRQIKIRARAMVLTKNALFFAGPPDVIPEDDPYGAFEGRLGCRLVAADKDDGTTIQERTMEELPVFDGLIAADNRLFMSTQDGGIICFAK